ncbi:hypothetical protein [Leucobacter chromiiresistens]|uniref:Uncharacterized protein n=1 Tax=Leucobacter chromiiresistens TaxID=1079994 RepID=A0A1H0Y9C9_9MICO|nr:hypothetical protein [Leucobacter chromiiresistens]SDQ11496.1 hypothetical protein SAMN04488565_0631 [Leucobacter chromiiresistens]
MRAITPQQLAQQWVSPILGGTGMIGVAFGYDRIVKKWMPEQVDELEATGRLMLELAAKLRTVGEGDGEA